MGGGGCAERENYSKARAIIFAVHGKWGRCVTLSKNGKALNSNSQQLVLHTPASTRGISVGRRESGKDQ